MIIENNTWHVLSLDYAVSMSYHKCFFVVVVRPPDTVLKLVSKFITVSLN